MLVIRILKDLTLSKVFEVRYWSNHDINNEVHEELAPFNSTKLKSRHIKMRIW